MACPSTVVLQFTDYSWTYDWHMIKDQIVPVKALLFNKMGWRNSKPKLLFTNEKLFFPHEHIFWKEILCWMYLKECGPIFILHNKSQAVSWNASVALKSFEEKRTAHHRSLENV